MANFLGFVAAVSLLFVSAAYDPNAADEIKMPSERSIEEAAADTVEMPPDEIFDDAETAAEAVSRAAEQAAHETKAAAELDRAIKRMETTYYRRGRWDIRPGYGSCSVITNQGALFDYDDRLNTLQVTIEDGSIKSLRDGEVRRLKSAFLERATKKAFFIRLQPFKVMIQGSTTFLQATYDAEMLGPMAKYDVLAFYTDRGVLVRSYDLAGSAAMVANLRRCAAEESVRNPSDPFTR